MTRIRNDSRLGALLKVTTQRSVTECATQCPADTRFSRPGEGCVPQIPLRRLDYHSPRVPHREFRLPENEESGMLRAKRLE